jgi:hypothetical protein
MGKVKRMLEEDMERNPHKYEPDPFDFLDKHIVICSIPEKSKKIKEESEDTDSENN